MTSWWQTLSERERRLIFFGGIFVVLLSFYELVYSPLIANITKTQDQIRTQQATLAFMQQATTRIDQLRAKGYHVVTPKTDLLTAVETAFNQNHLQGYIQQIKQTSPTVIVIHFDQVPFDTLVASLQNLQHRGLLISRATVQKTTQPGLVKAKITLQQ